MKTRNKRHLSPMRSFSLTTFTQSEMPPRPFSGLLLLQFSIEKEEKIRSPELSILPSTLQFRLTSKVALPPPWQRYVLLLSLCERTLFSLHSFPFLRSVSSSSRFLLPLFL
ncbi:hypothetical protein TGP89_365630 [Toxoplasma gondii p89]|uniref:Uncharacterized protein n=1 Tax=Toxoplasma gondii p89 TaxID=943119 RepID=A0A086KQ12_TOXGO|nr:hypothetical protein TGP89_365630 [Toxoplasma gondii p89]